MLKNVLKSRKFWAALVGLVYSFVAVLLPDFPIREETMTNGIAILMTYILSVALEDGLRGNKR